MLGSDTVQLVLKRLNMPWVLLSSTRWSTTQADRIVNTDCHLVGQESIPKLISDLASRRMNYFRSMFDAVYRKVRRGGAWRERW